MKRVMDLVLGILQFTENLEDEFPFREIVIKGHPYVPI